MSQKKPVSRLEEISNTLNLPFPLIEKEYLSLPFFSEHGSFLVLSVTENAPICLYDDAMIDSCGLYASIGKLTFSIMKLAPFESVGIVNELNENVDIGYMSPPFESGIGYRFAISHHFVLQKGIAKASPEFIKYVKDNSSYKI